jgi:DNA-binding HxlR family transcriptional regulator
MKRTELSHHPCSIARTLDVAGEWWTLLIVRDVAYGVKRFREIQEDLGISANVLADRLDTLVEEGILERVAYQERPLRHEYRLTEKGAELVPVLLALKEWGDRWTWPGGQGPVEVLHGECGHHVHVETHCPQCQREVEAAELRARLRWPDKAPSRGEPSAISAERLAAGRPLLD